MTTPTGAPARGPRLLQTFRPRYNAHKRAFFSPNDALAYNTGWEVYQAGGDCPAAGPGWQGWMDAQGAHVAACMVSSELAHPTPEDEAALEQAGPQRLLSLRMASFLQAPAPRGSARRTLAVACAAVACCALLVLQAPVGGV